MHVCKKYGILWDIKFNPAESQVTRFGPGSKAFVLVISTAQPSQWLTKSNTLVCFFNANRGSVTFLRPLLSFKASLTT